MSQPVNIASPAATGGAGTIFEHQVGAVFLGLLLTRGIPVVFKDCQVEEVGFQTQRLGWETDDLLVVCSSVQHGQRRLAIQVKRTLNIRASSTDCQETFQGFWKDFNDSDKFEPDHDALVIVTLRGTNTLLEGLGGLLDCARNSSDEADFTYRMATQGLSSRESRNCGSVIRSIIEEADSSAPNGKDFWHFLKAVHLLGLDLTTSTAQAESMTKQALAMACELSNPLEVADTTWLKLIEVASSAAMGGRTLRRQDLPEDLLSRHVTIDGPEMRLQIFRDHTQLILDGIRSTIAGSVKIPRDELRQAASGSLAEHHALVLTGPPGGGKSALAKSLVLSHQGDHECLSFRGEDFAKSSIDDVLQARMTGLQLKTLLGAQERVLIHVESVERLLEHAVRDAFADLVRIAEECENVHLLLTCRDYAAAAAVTSFFNQGTPAPAVIAVPPLSDTDLDDVATSLPGLEVPFSNPRIKDLLRNPFLLDLAAKLDWLGEHELPTDVIAFRQRCWNELVRRDGMTAAGMPDRRERALIDLSEKRARELRALVPPDGMDSEALDALYKDGVVSKDANGFVAPGHDVIEDWAVMRWTAVQFAKHQWQAHPISTVVGEHPAIRRGFREWLKESLESESVRTDNFVLSCYADSAVPRHFRDDVIVSMLRSTSVRSFVSRQQVKLLERDGELLAQVVHLLRVACKKAPDWLGGRYAPPSVWLEPDGDAWPVIMELAAEEFDTLLPTHSGLLLGLLEDWSQGASQLVPTPDGAESAGHIAFGLLERAEGWRGNDDQRKRILQMIAKVPCCDSARFTTLVEKASLPANRRDPVSGDLAEVLLGGIEGAIACRDFPELMANFAMSWWCLLHENPERAFPDWMPDTDHAFGLRHDAATELFPPSAMQGPFLWLLKQHPEIGVRLVLDLANHAADWYGKGKSGSGILEPAFRITLSVPGHGTAKQWANEHLWLAYRGTSVTPYVVQSALMALEYWLLELCENDDPVESWLATALVESNNVMTTAVVASVCNACPAAGGQAMLALLTSREVFGLDLSRMVKERDAEMLNAMPNPLPTADRHRRERERSNALEHRPYHLETLACQLQFAGKDQEVWEILDCHYDGIPNGDNRTRDDRLFLLALHRMDARKWELGEQVPTLTNGSADDGADTRVAFRTHIREMDDDLQNYVDESAQTNEPLGTSLGLLGWGLAEWERRQQDGDGMTWPTALSQAKELQHRHRPATDFDQNAVGYVAALCIRDHWHEMSTGNRRWCLDTVTAEIERECDSADPMVRASNDKIKADRPAAFILPMVLSMEPDDVQVLTAVARSITHASHQVKVWCAEGAHLYLATGHQDLLMRCAGAFAMSARALDDQEQRTRADFIERTGARQRGRGIWKGIKRRVRLLLSVFRSPKVADYGWYGPTASLEVRNAFINHKIDFAAEIASMDFDTWSARSVVVPLSVTLSTATGFDLAQDLHHKMARVVVGSWEAYSKDYGVGRQSDSNHAMMQRICGFVLNLPSDEALRCCQPFLDAVADHPSEVAFFVGYLVAQEDVADGNGSCFWDVWNTLADKAVDAPWAFSVVDRYSEGASLVDSILFYLPPWEEDVHHWRPLEGHGHDVDAFVSSMPPAPPVLMAYARYLHGIGRRSLPEAFAVVAHILRNGVPEDLLSDGNTVYYLEILLGRYVHGEPSRLKSAPTLRDDVLYILDQLVTAGSSAAYIMRDDFVTPTPSEVMPGGSETIHDPLRTV